MKKRTKQMISFSIAAAMGPVSYTHLDEIGNLNLAVNRMKLAMRDTIGRCV